MRNWAFAFLLACVLLAPVPACAQSERILDYHSDIEVRADATMVVTETIRVISAGDRIRHGIYRDFPTRYNDRLGNHYEVGFELISATRDGAPETTRVESLSNGERIYLGRSNVFLDPGEHTYTIAYVTNRQLGFFADYDELFWNVTGNGWIFPIDRASATVHLPAGISSDQVKLGGYTGPQGSMRTDLTYSADADDAFQFESEHSLPAYNGLTIRLDIPKGHFTPPTRADLARYFVHDNRDALIAAAGFVLVLLYYLAAWVYAGRDPARGTIVVQYEPPADFSPAAIRYLVRMGYDNKVFASSVIDMAVRGFVTIENQAGSYTLYRTKADNRVLSPDEKVVASALFGDGRTEIWLHNENHQTISSAIAALKRWLKTGEQKTYFVTNGVYLIPAIVLSALVFVGVASTEGPPKMIMAAFICVWLSFWSIGVYALVATAAHLWSSILTGASGKAAGLGGAVVLSLFSIPFLGGEVMGLWFLTQATSSGVAAVLVATIALHVVFHHLLKAPTCTGRAILDKVEGFKIFLGAVDGDRMNRATPPNKTPEVFEKFLPYALSLDLEQAWAQQFAGALGGASQAPGSGSGYSPAWYSGGDWNSMGATGFASVLAGSFSSAIASSSSAPGSAGSGGGGSGGGGGGGGGGGW
ncbi:MAG TPA: DUF2207 domain-containing protein [Candidatus Acidoferrales bacterium]|nr:DUF2207 domain-containing protein [Candidatus Acidoferrales bacterium]